MAAEDGRANSKVVVGVVTPIIRDKGLSAFSQPGANFNQHWSCHHRATLAVTPVFAFNLGPADWSREWWSVWGRGGASVRAGGVAAKDLDALCRQRNMSRCTLLILNWETAQKRKLFRMGGR